MSVEVHQSETLLSSLPWDVVACPDCGGERVFIAVEEFETGRVGYCLGCERRLMVEFSRVTGEAA